MLLAYIESRSLSHFIRIASTQEVVEANNLNGLIVSYNMVLLNNTYEINR